MGGCTCPYKSHRGDEIASLQFIDSPLEPPPLVPVPVPPFFGTKSGVIPLTLKSITALLDQTSVIEQWGYKNRGLALKEYLKLLDNGPNQTYRTILNDIVSNNLVDIKYKYGYFYARSRGNFLLLSQVPEMFYSGDLASGRQQYTLLFRRSLVAPFYNIPDFFHPASSLTEASLTASNLTEANLTASSLTEANLTASSLTEANLTASSLTEANLTASNLTEANLTASNLTASNLTASSLTASSLTEANLTASNLTEANLTASSLTEANLTEVQSQLPDMQTNTPEGTMGKVDVAPLGLFTLGNAANETLRSLLDSHDYKGYYFYHIVFSNLVAGVCNHISDIIRKDLGLSDGVGVAHTFGASRYARTDDYGVVATLLESDTIAMPPPPASENLILRGQSGTSKGMWSASSPFSKNYDFSMSYAQGFIFTHHPDSSHLLGV